MKTLQRFFAIILMVLFANSLSAQSTENKQRVEKLSIYTIKLSPSKSVI